MTLRIRAVLVLVAVASVTGVAVLFLPFTWSTSPLAVLQGKNGDLWGLALPTFLIVPIAVGGVRFARFGRFSRVEGLVAYALAIGCAGLGLWFWLSHFSDPDSNLLMPILLPAGGLLIWRNRRVPGARDLNPLTAIEVPYAANMVHGLALFNGDWEVGAHVAIVATAAVVAAMVLGSRQTGA